ncbi:MAG: hypothetical protein OXF25_02495 [Cyanobacteria bacterium MAG CAR3_bin_5]|nr:hypothetical protein [Cyanobacteria bacterium MAG CAR3_bin_5]
MVKYGIGHQWVARGLRVAPVSSGGNKQAPETSATRHSKTPWAAKVSGGLGNPRQSGQAHGLKTG